MPPPTRIFRLSAWLYWASTLLALHLPCVVVLAILQGWFDPAALRRQFASLPATTPISDLQALLVAGLGAVSVVPMVAAFLAMRSLFRRYQRGEILTDACATDILRIGVALVVVAVATVLVPMAQLLVLSWANGPGGRMLQVGIEGGTLGFLLAGGLLFTIGWVMREAARAARENAEFV